MILVLKIHLFLENFFPSSVLMFWRCDFVEFQIIGTDLWKKKEYLKTTLELQWTEAGCFDLNIRWKSAEFPFVYHDRRRRFQKIIWLKASLGSFINGRLIPAGIIRKTRATFQMFNEVLDGFCEWLANNASHLFTKLEGPFKKQSSVCSWWTLEFELTIPKNKHPLILKRCFQAIN